MLHPNYKWLLNIPVLPKMVQEAIKLLNLNISEYAGASSNPLIMELASEAGVTGIYTSDEMAWCAVGHTAVALRAGKDVPFTGYDRLRAKSFKKFGKHTDIPMLGDTLIFRRPGGYHVAIYIAEDYNYYHVAGANQGNSYSITRIKKSRLDEARTPIYKSGQPESVKRYFVSPVGNISHDEG